jgi:monofunctional biosynthetic peptidoglycan transglycosylase
MPETKPERRPAGLIARIIPALCIVLAIILLLPYALTPLYRVVDPVSTLMLWRWARGARVVRTVVPLERIAPVLPVTVIASEDGRFCYHRGVDLEELRDALQDAGDLSEARGGSTLTQQVAKNLFLWPGRSLLRKALEFPLALWIDFVLPKRRVMEIYLNIAEWGPSGEFGAEAASRYAFNKPALSLSAREAALLAAAVLPNPHRRSARLPRPGVRRLAVLYEARAAAQAALASCVKAARAPKGHA